MQIESVRMRTKEQESIIAAIGALARVARRSSDRSLAGLGITGAQGSVLTYIYFNDGACQKDIERHFMMSRATVSGLIDSLETLGLISRALPEGDRRRRVLALTDKGLAMVSASFDRIGMLDSLLRSLLPDEGKGFLDTCRSIIGSLEGNLC